MHVHTVEIEVVCTELIAIIEKGKYIRRPFARTGQQCIAKLTVPLHTCMEPFEKMPSMGRITLRDEGRTIAIGKILECIVKENKWQVVNGTIVAPEPPTAGLANNNKTATQGGIAGAAGKKAF